MVNMETVMEDVIKYLQNNQGHASSKDIPSWKIPENYQTWGHLILRLENEGYITGNANSLTLTKLGWDFISFENIKTKEGKETEKKEKENEKLTVDLANAKRVYKTYNSTRWMAIASFVFSLLLLILKLAEALKLWPYNK